MDKQTLRGANGEEILSGMTTTEAANTKLKDFPSPNEGGFSLSEGLELRRQHHATQQMEMPSPLLHFNQHHTSPILTHHNFHNNNNIVNNNGSSVAFVGHRKRRKHQENSFFSCLMNCLRLIFLSILF